MSESSERRQTRRVEIRIPVTYRGPDGTAKSATTANVSGRGMLIVARDSAAPGTRLRVAVTGADGHEREVAGEVVRAGEGHLAIALHDEASVLQSLIDSEARSPVE